MHRNSRIVSVLKARPSAGFWVAVPLGAFLIIFGLTAVVEDFRYYRPNFSKESFMLVATISLGVLLMSLALLCERPGRLQRAFVVGRNSLIALIILVIALILLLFALGPLH